MRNFWKQKIGSLLLILVLGVFNFGFLLSPNSAHAQAPDVVAKLVQQDVTTVIQTYIKNALVAGLVTGLVNLLVSQLNTFAYDSAVWVASGGNAEDPLFDPRPIEDYLRYAGAEIAAEAISEITSSNIVDGVITQFNVQLPDDANLLAAIRNGIESTYVPTLDDESFNFNDIKDNWQGYLVDVYADDQATAQEKTEVVLQALAQSFDPGVNQLSSGLQIYSQTINEAQQEASVKKEKFLKDEGFVDVTDVTGQYIETPASFVREKIAHAIERSTDGPMEISTTLLANSDSLIGIGINAASIFTNTLISELMNKVSGGLFQDIATDFTQVNPFDANSVVTSSRERAQERLKSLSAFRPLTVTDYNLLSEFTTCPSSFRGINRKLYNCVLDTSFSSAVAKADSGAPMTLAEAIEDGYIDGDWPLIPSSDTARNQDSQCYTYGFCHSNIVKLRKARIVPVGWELAAESSSNSSSNPVTLNEVMNAFNSCNADNELDDDYPWCHLIDPNWVLKYPETSCRTLAYGQLIQSSGTDARSTECVDQTTCIAEDENGNCTGGWGYCVREKNTWNFRGDECPEQYASCLSFTTEAGSAVDYLVATVDYAGCNANNAGCQWYATAKREVEDVFDWPTVNNEIYAQESDSASEYRIYLNSNVETCSEESAGCTELVERDTDTRLNLVPNPSFENDEDEDSWPDAWISTDFAGVEFSTSGEDRSGTSAARPTSSTLYQTGLTLGQRRFYSFSFYAKQGDTADTMRAALSLYDETGEDDVDLTGYSYTGDCTLGDLDGDSAYESLIIDATPSSDSYERYECTFTAPSLSTDAKLMQAYINFYSADVWVDDVQLEQGEEASIFRTGYGSSLSEQNLAYAKMPPAYLGCTGSSEDPAECADYATMCTEDDVGCELFTPSNGDPTITGVTTDLDTCPASCVGYDTYKQEPTRYEPNGSFPEYFIPDSAEECSEEEVGCDEFTNLTTEEPEYFTYLRACVTTDQALANTGGDGEAVFYTWEGSDTEGFQLKTWHLLESDLDASSYANYGYDTDDDGTDDYTEVNPGVAPCTNWATSASSVTCDDDSTGDGVIDTATDECDEHDDIFSNPDCREFYDADGAVHYRLWEETVTVDDACVSYRKTDIAGLGEDGNGDGVDDGNDNCTDSGGWFEEDTNTCRYYGWADESTSCSEAVNGCREYTGGRSGNSRQVYEELFEDDGLTPFEAAASSYATLSNESIATDGHSVAATQVIWTYLYEMSSTCTTEGGCDSSTGNLGGTCTVAQGDDSCGTLEGELQTDKTYTVSFWAKGSGTIDVGFDINASTSSVAIDTNASFEDDVELSGSWQEFQLGPLDMNATDFPLFGDGTVLVFKVDSGSTLYLDNVVLREGEQNIAIIKDSWVTPAVCDQDLNGNSSDQYYLGCAEYLDSDSNTVNLKSFSRLCEEDKVGCTGYFATANSDSEYTAMYNAVCENVDADADGSADEASSNTTCYLLTNSANTAFDSNSTALCTISGGSSSCQFDTEYLIPEIAIDSNTALSHISLAADTLVVSADRDVFAIVDSEDECFSSEASCTEVGQPTYTADRSAIDSYTSVYLLNDPDSYDDILCEQDEQFCAAFDGGAEGTYYFKDPTGQTCEYKTDVTVGSSSYDGWFRTGTTEFCYGTGSCSDDSSSCSNDSDCRVGACSTSGSACYTDFDCDTDETCSISDPEATCQIEDGSYLVGGDYSEIWRNGDTAFDNWTGTCSTEWSGCSEFQDQLDFAGDEFYGETDGESYFFIDNDNLDENTLVTSQQCNGQVSNKLGCVLFNDTSEPGLDYNSTATYIASVHADELFGDSSFDLVDPIDCDSGADSSTITEPDGDTVDLCAQRCVYRRDLLESATFDASGVSTVIDSYELGGSCYDDNDCATYVSETGDTVTGTCETQVSSYTPSSGSFSFANGNADVTRLEDDSNRVLKVNRDRECSEWLTCSSSQTVWDEATGKYKIICDGIDLCTEYSALGDSSFCSAWNPDDPTVILDDDRYATRDVSWYGEELSGYAIPNSYPVQRLSQVNIAGTGECLSATSVESGVTCDSDSDCPTSYPNCEAVNEQDYRLAYDAGECDDGYGNECTVGYCADTAAPCSSTDDCAPDGGECIVGACYDVTSTSCDADTDCASGESCLSGTCMQAVGDCGLDSDCLDSGEDDSDSTAATCFPSVSVRTGSCYRERCIVAPNGDQFDEEVAETQVCRAWPEANSPFPNQVVKEWSKPTFSSGAFSELVRTESTPSDRRYLPFNRFPGFDTANVCLPGEDCDCNYTKLGTAYGNTAYIDDDTNSAEIETDLESTDSVEASVGHLGICSGGDSNGSLCIQNSDCGDTTLGAMCNPITKEDNLIGLQGYCLERDTGISILGQADLGACLTWFPVDQLSGSTDLYAKYKNAGFFDDVYMCTESRPFIDLRTSVTSRSVGNMACAEIESGDCTKAGITDDIEACGRNAQCPDNYFAIVGACAFNDSIGDGFYAAACEDSAFAGDNDCPYICVPEGSHHGDDATACSPSASSFMDTYEASFGTVYMYNHSGGEYGEEIPADDDDSWYSDFDNVVSNYSDCILRGVDFTDDVMDSTINFSSGDPASTDGYRYLDMVSDDDYHLYAACGEVANVATSDESYAWTDRVYTDGYSISASTSNVEYTKDVAAYPFGAVSRLPQDVGADNVPIRLAECYNESDFLIVPPDAGTDSLFTTCPSGYTAGNPWVTEGVDPADPYGRTFVDFTIDYTGRTEADTWSVNPTSKQTLLDNILQIFAEMDVGSVYEWSGGLGVDEEYETISTATSAFSSYDIDVRESEGTPPTVWSLDTDNCYGSYCREGVENAITVNDSNEGDQTGEGGFFRGTVKFFAAADKNQLPIRRVIVDWGDGYLSGSNDTDNYYKNHRGLLPESQSQSYCDVCDSTSSDVTCEWGMTADSCDPNYFQYQHNYRCSDSNLLQYDTCTDDDGDGVIDSSPCSDGTACYFRPAIHVRDNWGWCTGTCTGLSSVGDGTEPGCYDGDGSLSGSDVPGSSECYYTYYPENSSVTDPWVYYDGQIVVTP